MKKAFFPLMIVAALALSTCALPTGVATPQPLTADQAATIAAATMQAIPSNTPAPPTADACQIPTLKASDAPSDCFNGSGEPVACAGFDLLSVEAGMIGPVVQGQKLPAGFIIRIAEQPGTAQEFALYLYLDLDQNPSTGLEMSTGAGTVPGIDRLIGVTLPSAESWTQAVARGADAEIIRDESQVSASVSGDMVTIMVARELLVDKSVAAGEQTPLTLNSTMPVGYALGGALPDAFTFYAGVAGDTNALDFFNSDQDIHIPLSMTVPKEALYPVCAGGS